MIDVECGYGDAGGVLGHQHLIHHGPVIPVQIGYDPAYSLDIPGAVPTLGPKRYRALIDTGSTVSSIDSVLAEELGLRVIDQQRAFGIGGEQWCYSFLAQVYMPSLRFTVSGRFKGVHLSAGGPYRALIGRNFLTHFKMVYEGWTGSVKLTARVAMFP